MYNAIAEFYNKKMNEDNDYKAWRDYLLAFIGNERKNGIDLACGTGLMTFLLCEKGKKIIGVDNSQSMLAVAEKNKLSKNNVEFINFDIRKFKPMKKVDFVTIVCDGINYIPHNNLLKLFKNIYSMLNENGILLFDISSEFKLKNIIGNNIFYCDEKEYTYLWTNQLEKNYIDMNLIVFDKNKDNSYNRSDEEHRQYIYTEAFILNALADAGFKEYKAYSFMKTIAPDNNDTRIQFVAGR